MPNRSSIASTRGTGHHISIALCEAMRTAYKKRTPAAEIAVLTKLSEHTVWYHLGKECRHLRENDVPKPLTNCGHSPKYRCYC